MFGSLKRPPDWCGPSSQRAGARGAWRWPGRVLLVLLAVTVVAGVAGCAITVGGTDTAGGNTMTLPIKVVKGADNAALALVGVTINGQGPYDFIVDTGASITLIDSALARQLALPHTGGRQPVSGVGGTQLVVFVDVANWKLGTIALPRSSIGSGTLPTVRGESGFQGLLGSDIWSQFGTITIDYNAGTLTVYKRIAERAASYELVEYQPDVATRQRAA